MCVYVHGVCMCVRAWCVRCVCVRGFCLARKDHRERFNESFGPRQRVVVFKSGDQLMCTKSFFPFFLGQGSVYGGRAS